MNYAFNLKLPHKTHYILPDEAVRVYQLNVQPVEEPQTSQIRVTGSPSVNHFFGETLKTVWGLSEIEKSLINNMLD